MLKKYYQISVFMFAIVLMVFLGVAPPRAVDADTGVESVELPIIMYHSILGDAGKAGKYVVTPEQLAEDLQYIRERGYETVTISQLQRYVEGTGDLPAKPVLITFDDGYYNNLSYAYPLLKENGMTAVVSIIGKYTEQESTSGEKQNNNYSQLTWEELRDARDVFEIGNHSYDMHGNDGRRGARRREGESDEAYRQAIREDIGKLQDAMRRELGAEADVFAYPFGYYTADTEAILRELGFAGSLTCYEHVNTIQRGGNLYGLGRYNRAYGKSAVDFFAKILR